MDRQQQAPQVSKGKTRKQQGWGLATWTGYGLGPKNRAGGKKQGNKKHMPHHFNKKQTEQTKRLSGKEGEKKELSHRKRAQQKRIREKHSFKGKGQRSAAMLLLNKKNKGVGKVGGLVAALRGVRRKKTRALFLGKKQIKNRKKSGKVCA